MDAGYINELRREQLRLKQEYEKMEVRHIMFQNYYHGHV